MIDQNSPHGSRRDSKEMRTTLPVLLVRTMKSEIEFVDQCRGLQGVIGALRSESAHGHAMELSIEVRNEPTEVVPVSFVPIADWRGQRKFALRNWFFVAQGAMILRAERMRFR